MYPNAAGGLAGSRCSADERPIPAQSCITCPAILTERRRGSSLVICAGTREVHRPPAWGRACGGANSVWTGGARCPTPPLLSLGGMRVFSCLLSAWLSAARVTACVWVAVGSRAGGEGGRTNPSGGTHTHTTWVGWPRVRGGCSGPRRGKPSLIRWRRRALWGPRPVLPTKHTAHATLCSLTWPTARRAPEAIPRPPLLVLAAPRFVRRAADHHPQKTPPA